MDKRKAYLLLTPCSPDFHGAHPARQLPPLHPQQQYGLAASCSPSPPSSAKSAASPSTSATKPAPECARTNRIPLRKSHVRQNRPRQRQCRQTQRIFTPLRRFEHRSPAAIAVRHARMPRAVPYSSRTRSPKPATLPNTAACLRARRRPGICAAALNGAPGVLSARYAGANPKSDAANNKRLSDDLDKADKSSITSASSPRPPRKRPAAHHRRSASGAANGRQKPQWNPRFRLRPAFLPARTQLHRRRTCP